MDSRSGTASVTEDSSTGETPIHSCSSLLGTSIRVVLQRQNTCLSRPGVAVDTEERGNGASKWALGQSRARAKIEHARVGLVRR